MQGVVKFYDAKNGFGFVTGEDGVDYFLPYANIAHKYENEFRRVNRNAAVTFDPSDSDKGPVAVNVVEIQRDSKPAA